VRRVVRQQAGVGRQDGFTLLEMVVAIAITALLVTAAVEAHVSIIRNLRARVFERGRDVTAQRVLDRIERELLSTQLVAKAEEVPREKHPWIFQGIDGGSGATRPDTIRFITSNGGSSGAGPLGLRLVSYTANAPGDFGSDLFRTEEPMPEALPPQPPRAEGEPSLTGVVQFQLRYQDPDSSLWQDTWDSTQKDTLPKAVEITLELAERIAPGEEPTEAPEGEAPSAALQRVVVLPVKAIAVRAPAAGAEGMCEQGPTVRECLQVIVQGSLELSEQALNSLREAAELEPNACIQSDGEESTAVGVLRDTLQEENIDLAEICP
jgi:prepilin-type N-terminal cleavage/methylation domain-containing protein